MCCDTRPPGRPSDAPPDTFGPLHRRCGGRGRTQPVGDAQDTDRCTVEGDEDDGPASLPQFPGQGRRAGRGRIVAPRGGRAGVPASARRPSSVAFTPAPGVEPKSATGLVRSPRSRAAVTIAAGGTPVRPCRRPGQHGLGSGTASRQRRGPP
ncbi:hypothetical protein GCM10015536_53260 [Streptomyces griseomycini]|nr:hypothetical protein GCM10015536_53260 [Streptomyces griseomycini]